MKMCTKCNTDKPESEFSKHLKGLQPKCKTCDKIISRARYRRIPHSYYTYNKQRRISRRVFVNSLKSKCNNCSENDPCCLDFHHTRDKITNISKLFNGGVSKQKILEEVAKCIVLCANCHRKLHNQELITKNS